MWFSGKRDSVRDSEHVSKYYYSYWGEIYSQYWENNFNILISSILEYNPGRTNNKFIIAS